MLSTGLSSSAQPVEALATQAEIVVGVASYNNAETIAAVLRAVQDGLDTHFASRASCIILADGASNDHTVDQARQAVADGSPLIAVQYPRPTASPLAAAHPGSGRPAAIQALLRSALDCDAQACAVVDAGLLSITPDWIPRLLSPPLTGGVDYVSPVYRRHPYEGAITKSILYPMFRALYGVRLRQPAAHEFACSQRLMRHYLDQDFWTHDDAEAGIDLWLAVTAVTDGYRVSEAALGVRTHASRGVSDLSATLVMLVGALFSDLEARADTWQRVRGSVDVPVSEEVPERDLTVPDVDVGKLVESFRLGYRALSDLWAWILPPKAILQLRRLADAPPERFRIDDELWARIVFDFALAFRLRTMPRDHLLGLLTPLYLGWLASFILDVDDADPAVAEQRLDRVAQAFEAQKAYLISRWRWPDRFRS